MLGQSKCSLNYDEVVHTLIHGRNMHLVDINAMFMLLSHLIIIKLVSECASVILMVALSL